METKQCRICNQTKLTTEYNKSGKYSRSECRICQKEIKRKWYEDNKEHALYYKKKYDDVNSNVILQKKREYNATNKDKISVYNKIKYHSHREYNISRVKRYYTENKDVILLSRKNDLKKNPDKYKAKRIKRQASGKISAYVKNKRQTDIQFRIRLNVRSRLSAVMRNQGAKKSIRSVELLGCTYAFLKDHLESKFDSNMSWDNYGKYWHIDHILPLSCFDLTNDNQIRVACHYTNLQPLEAIENIKKSNKILING